MYDFEPIEKELKLKFKNLEMKVVYLYYIESNSINRISKTLNCANETVKKHLIFGMRSRQKSLKLRSTDEYREKLQQSQTGDRNHQAKLTESDILEIRAEYEKLQGTFNKSQAQYLLAEDYGVKRPTISDIVLRKTWKHV